MTSCTMSPCAKRTLACRKRAVGFGEDWVQTLGSMHLEGEVQECIWDLELLDGLNARLAIFFARTKHGNQPAHVVFVVLQDLQDLGLWRIVLLACGCNQTCPSTT